MCGICLDSFLISDDLCLSNLPFETSLKNHFFKWQVAANSLRNQEKEQQSLQGGEQNKQKWENKGTKQHAQQHKTKLAQILCCGYTKNKYDFVVAI